MDPQPFGRGFLYLLNNIIRQNKVFPIAKHKPFEQFAGFRIKVQKNLKIFCQTLAKCAERAHLCPRCL